MIKFKNINSGNKTKVESLVEQRKIKRLCQLEAVFLFAKCICNIT